jgi:hypothetical protein
VDVSRILQIPINNHGFSDFIAWHYTKHGQYAVRSGYHLQWRHQFGPRANQLALPGSSAINPVWKILWKLNVPSKVKIFMWRFLHGILPLKSILANRHIGNNGSCTICRLGAEDTNHLFFRCHVAQEVWTKLGIYHIIEDAMQYDREGSAVLEHLLKREDLLAPGYDLINLKEIVSVACWYMWWMRRQRTHNEDVPPLFKCIHSILSITSNAARACKKDGLNRMDTWSKPEP